MRWVMSFLKPSFRTVQEAERAAFRLFAIGFIFLVLGTIFFMAQVWPPTGIIAIIIGVIVLAGNVLRLMLASKRNTITKQCPRCGKPNHIFQQETYFKCAFCDNVVILKDI